MEIQTETKQETQDRLITRFSFDLSADNRRTAGTVEIRENGVGITGDGAEQWIPMEGIREFRCDVGVGSVTLECTDAHIRALCHVLYRPWERETVHDGIS